MPTAILPPTVADVIALIETAVNSLDAHEGRGGPELSVLERALDDLRRLRIEDRADAVKPQPKLLCVWIDPDMRAVGLIERLRTGGLEIRADVDGCWFLRQRGAS